MSGNDHQSNATRDYQQPEASQAERRRILQQDQAARSYFDIANGDPDDARGRTPVVGVSPVYGADLPAPAWAHDPTGKEPPLGADVNALPDMRACWWIEGAVAPGERPNNLNDGDNDAQSTEG